MKIHTSAKDYGEIKNPVISVGSFDGLHKGHRYILKQLINTAKESGGESVVFTFDPHPRLVLDPDNDQIRLLTNREEKQLLFEELGIDHLILYPFTKEFAATPPDVFVEEVLIKQLGLKKLIIGFDHFFGKDRSGGIELITELSKKYNFGVEVIESINDQDEKISSTKIRKSIMSGDIDRANNYLGHPYVIYGEVVSGYQRGTKLGFPTANLELNNPYKLVPPDGVYAVRVLIEGKRMGGMMNIGIRPTFSDNGNRTLEIHIFGLDKKIYGQVLTIELIKKLRNEVAFDNVDALKLQLEADKKNSLEVLKSWL